MTVRQAVNHPTIPYRIVYNRTESAARNLRWPMYTDDALPLALAQNAGRSGVFSLIDYNNPQQNINNVNFGRITGASGARTFQLGARLTF